MTQEKKQLLLKDLYARLPYDVCVHIRYKEGEPCYGKLIPRDIQWFIDSKIEVIKPYLRPISSMSNEEVDKLFSILNIDEENETEWLKVNNTNVIRLFTQEGKDFYEIAEAMDYLYSIHIDFRNLTEKGLALEAPEGMYK